MYSVLESEPMNTCLVDRWLDTYCSLLDSAHEHTPAAVSWTQPMNTCLLDRWLNTYCSLLDYESMNTCLLDRWSDTYCNLFEVFPWATQAPISHVQHQKGCTVYNRQCRGLGRCFVHMILLITTHKTCFLDSI